jgi:hypothetical protein
VGGAFLPVRHGHRVATPGLAGSQAFCRIFSPLENCQEERSKSKVMTAQNKSLPRRGEAGKLAVFSSQTDILKTFVPLLESVTY